MSDYEDEFMCDEDEDYDLEYSEDSNSEPDVDLENQYYNSKVRIREVWGGEGTCVEKALRK